MGDFKLSASLEGHADDVRAVVFPSPNLVISASRDATVQTWEKRSETPPKYESTLSSHGTGFKNALTFLPPNSKYKNGLIISGGRDAIVEARQPGASSEDNAEGLMIGHANNICALDVSPKGDFVVSGSWDGKGRIWKIDKWECEAELDGHNGNVWAVLAFDEKTVITGCADHMIRFFDLRGKMLKAFNGGSDVVRALCRVTSDVADFASAGNDGVIRLWKMNGEEFAQLHGHESFIYSLTSLPGGEIASSGEDRTVRIWKDGVCIQTITHPAISVWTVATCAENGDIVSGASDRVVRIFSRSRGRQATREDITSFDDAVKGSSIPQQQMGDINKEKLPGPEFLQQKSGTKEGQVQMIQESNGSISAHQWSQSSQSWTNVGTVVDAAGSSGRKQTYLGKDYDYVFDVDIEDGKPPLKLPFNLSQNPYEAATKFIQDNELPISYLDQVADFITKNTQGATLGQQQESAGSDTWGTDARYRPGENGGPSQPSKLLPQKTYLAIKTADVGVILKKLSEFNQKLASEGSKQDSLSEDLLETLSGARKTLESALSNGPTDDFALTEVVQIAVHVLETWPTGYLLPALDLLRLLAASTPSLAEWAEEGLAPIKATVIDLLQKFAFCDLDRLNNVMLGIRTLGNLFETKSGRKLLTLCFSSVWITTSDIAQRLPVRTNRNIAIALATVYLNFSVLAGAEGPTSMNGVGGADRSTSSAKQKKEWPEVLLKDINLFLKAVTDSEAVYRALVAGGTLLTLKLHEEGTARELGQSCAEIDKRVKEARIQTVCSEIRALTP